MFNLKEVLGLAPKLEDVLGMSKPMRFNNATIPQSSTNIARQEESKGYYNNQDSSSLNSPLLGQLKSSAGMNYQDAQATAWKEGLATGNIKNAISWGNTPSLSSTNMLGSINPTGLKPTGISPKLANILEREKVLKALTDFKSNPKSIPMFDRIEGYIKNFKNLKDDDIKYVGQLLEKETDTNILTVPKIKSNLLNFKTAEDYVKAQTPIFHGTPEKFTKFNTKISEGNATWFSASKDDILSGEAGAVQKAGQKLNIMERYPKPGLKLATPEMADKMYTDQLIAEGYKGVKYPKGEYGDYEWTKLFDPNNDTLTREQLIKLWNKAQPLKSLVEEAKKYKSAEADKLINKAIKEYGTTNVPESVGFITTDGRAIDSSGIKLGSPTQGRNIDHREIASTAFPDNYKLSDASDYLTDFMNKTNTVRIKSAGENGLNIDIVSYPTEEQFNYLKKLSTKSNGIYADISKSNGQVAKSSEFTKFSDYEKWVKDYFGIKDKYPEQIYKAINDAWGTKMSVKEIDNLSLSELRDNASNGLSGGTDEFNKLLDNWNKAKVKKKLK
jgi:hypothetical protein